MTGGRHCTKCGKWKGLEEFYKCNRSWCKECWREYNRAYRQTNPEKVNEYSRAWREANPEKVKEYNRAWCETNPEKARALWRCRRARKRDAEGSFTAEEWLALCEQHGNTCLCCGAAGALTADHVIPLSKGGTNYITNIQPLCHSCNSCKGVKTTDYRPQREEAS